MNINSSTQNPLQASLASADSSGRAMAADPVKGMVGLMQSEDGVAIAAKVNKVKDEMLGTIIDMIA